MKSRLILGILAIAAISLGFAYTQGFIPHSYVEGMTKKAFAKLDETRTKPPALKNNDATNAPAISVARVVKSDFIEHVLVTGSLTAREQILITPEVEGLRVLSYAAEEGDYVKNGQLLASLERTTLTSTLNQNTAAIARAQARISQTKSQIHEAEAVLQEAKRALKRAVPLTKAGHISKSTYDQREATSLSAQARLESANAGHELAKAEKAELLAQRVETTWRLSKSEIRSPVDGLISRRRLRIGDMASSTKQPMFEIIENGNIELEAEVDAFNLAKLKKGQTATIKTATKETITGTVRLVSPQIDASTRLGHAMITLGKNPALKVGGFARGTVETARSSGLAIPSTAILYSTNSTTVLRVKDNKVRSTPVKLGLHDGKFVEVLDGLTNGDLVVAKAGTFLRDGDSIRPVEPKLAANGVKK